VDQNSARQNDALKESYSLSSKKEGMIVSEVGTHIRLTTKEVRLKILGVDMEQIESFIASISNSKEPKSSSILQTKSRN